MEELNAGGRDHWTRWKGTVKWGEELGTFICRTENCPHSTENYHNPVPFLSSHYILTLPIITIKFPTEKSCGAKTTSKTQQYLTGMLRADLTFLHFSCFVTLVPLSELFIQWASLVKCFTVSPCPYELFILQTPPPNFTTIPLLFTHGQGYCITAVKLCPVKTSDASILLLPLTGCYQLGKLKYPAFISLSTWWR